MKNKREVILDFTSLLDVIMLILFFFVIFAQLDTSEAIAKAKTEQAQAEQQIEDAKAEWQAANEAREQANAELEQLEQANALAESIIISGADDFDRALRLKLMLSCENDSWVIKVNCSKQENGEVRYYEINKIDDVRNRDASSLAADFDQIITEYGYSKEDAFLCDLLFNSLDSGSNKAKRNTDQMMNILQNKLGYTHLFNSTTDLADLKE